MADACCSSARAGSSSDPRWRRVVWIALILNFAMFAVEAGAALFAQSRSLQADSLDFLGDAANYAISLGVAGLALEWRARAALLKGATIMLFGFGVLGWALWGLAYGARPDAYAMGAVGFAALLVNLAVAALLFRFRTGDANMRSVWICSRNDAINNGLVIAAGLAVYASGSGLPDLIVAFAMAALGIGGGWQVVRHALAELRETRTPRLTT